MNARKAYEQKLQAKLDAWRAEVKKIEARANEAVADSKLEYNRQIKGVRKKMEIAEKRLAKLKASQEDAWEDVKEGIEDAFTSLSEAVSSAMTRLR